MAIRAEQVETLASDLKAFKHKHPLERHDERVIATVVDGQIISTVIAFEIFRFSAPDVGDVTFDVRGIKAALATRKLAFAMYTVADLEAAWVEHVRINNGVEEKRMATLTAVDLERPGIFVVWPDGLGTLIDGNNRLVRRWDVGLKTFRFASVPVSRELAPYMCWTGEEDKFLDRDNAERGMTTLARTPMRIRNTKP